MYSHTLAAMLLKNPPMLLSIHDAMNPGLVANVTCKLMLIMFRPFTYLMIVGDSLKMIDSAIQSSSSMLSTYGSQAEGLKSTLNLGLAPYSTRGT